MSNYNTGLIWGSYCCPSLTSVRSRVRLDRCCVKLQYKTDLGKVLLPITDYYMVVALDCISFLSNYIVRLILRSYGHYKVAAPLDWNSVIANYIVRLIWGSYSCSLLTSIRSRVSVGRCCVQLTLRLVWNAVTFFSLLSCHIFGRACSQALMELGLIMFVFSFSLFPHIG